MRPDVSGDGVGPPQRAKREIIGTQMFCVPIISALLDKQNCTNGVAVIQQRTDIPGRDGGTKTGDKTTCEVSPSVAGKKYFTLTCMRILCTTRVGSVSSTSGVTLTTKSVPPYIKS